MGHRDFKSVAERLADDLVELHNDTGIELEYWENARLFVEHYYKVSSKVIVGRKWTPQEQEREEKGRY